MTKPIEEAPALPFSMDVRKAAEWLAANAPSKNAEQWFIWLQNNRAPERLVAFRLPYEKFGRQVIYETDHLKILAKATNVAKGLVPASVLTPEERTWLKSLTAKKPTAE